MNFHHIGIACKNIQATHEALGGLLIESAYDPYQKVACNLYDCNGTVIELIQGAGVKNVLRGNATQYHICYEVKDIDVAIHDMDYEGWRMIKAPMPAVLFGGRRVAFLMHRDAGMVELLEQ